MARRSDRLIVTLVALALVTTVGAFARPPVVAAGTTPFTDIAGTTFEADIEWLFAEGITKGCTATLYCPDDPVTRGQMASFLVRMFDLTDGGDIDAFTDDDGTTHEIEINKLAHAGITKGCTATTFCPKRSVRRDEMASFLARAIPLTAGAGNNYFRDDDGTTHEGNIDRLAAAGIASGCAAWKFCPTAGVTRGQMAGFLHRVVKPISPPPYPAPTGPQTLHVAIDGDDAGNGCTDVATPCATVRYALRTAMPGETISVGPGTFSELPWAIGASQTISGDSRGGTIIQATCAPYVGFLAVPEGRSLTIRRLTITGCHTDYPPPIDNLGVLEFVDVAISANSGAIGAIHNNGELRIRESSITGNHASWGGGAIFNRRSATIEDSVLSGNSSDGNGGAIVTTSSANAGILADLSVVRSAITGNASADRGGGIMAYSGGTVDIVGSTVSGNTAKNGAGLYNWYGGDLAIANSTIGDNAAAESGGGLYNLTANAVITNSTISGNTGATAGATFHRNDADWVEFTLALRNALIAGNPTITGAESRGVVATNLASIIGVPAGLTLADILDPAGLADNGGPTKTIALTDSTTNPALDKGDAATCVAAPVNGLDQRGLPRTPPCDIGAYELQP